MNTENIVKGLAEPVSQASQNRAVFPGPVDFESRDQDASVRVPYKRAPL
jgi:hypothetical protein